jgi:hypothetical protein
MSLNSGKQTILIVVASVALATGLIGWIGHQRRQAYLILAEHHLAEMATFDSASRSVGHYADMYEGKAPKEKILAFLNPVGDSRNLRSAEALNSRRAAYHSALSLKYRAAAARPWIAVLPDPPSP